MIEQVIPATVAIITGGAVIIQRVHNRINTVEKRIDTVELRIAESYVSKGDFNLALNRMEDHMVRSEEKLDELVKGARK